MLSTRGTGKWLTAIPLPYTGGDEFWGRDAGLICLGLRELGVDCRFVALGAESQPSDAPVILTSLANLQRADWWRQWRADAVLFYCWAAPRYEAVSRAIEESGSKLIVRLDTDGVTSPRGNFWPYLAKTFCAFHDEGKPAAALQAFAKSVLFRLCPPLYDDKVIRHLRHADYLAIESPGALQRYQQFLAACGVPELGAKLRVLPHPVPEIFRHDPAVPKQRKLLAVGRWESRFKDAPLLVRTLDRVLQREPEYRATIIGSGADLIERLLAKCAGEVRARIDVRPRVPQAQLVREYQEAQIVHVSSRSESFHLAAASGLCCGCSVTGPAAIPSLVWFSSRASGTVAATRSADDLAEATRAEIAAWRTGHRDPQHISHEWMNVVGTLAVARQCLELLAGAEGRRPRAE